MMLNKKFQFSLNDLAISIFQIETLLGRKEGADNSVIGMFIEEAMTESAGFFNIRAEYRIYENTLFEIRDKSISVNDICFDVKKIVFGQLKKSERIAVFACTAGGEIGERISELMAAGDPLKGYITDIIASMAVEAAADFLQNDLSAALGQSGQKITNRYSPGYCDWSVEEQHKLFRLLPDNFCKITLTESALMKPVKSVSGLIGIGEHVKFNKYTCHLCDMKNCNYRGIRTGEEIAVVRF